MQNKALAQIYLFEQFYLLKKGILGFVLAPKHTFPIYN